MKNKVLYILFIDLKQAYALKEALGDPDSRGSLYDTLECQDYAITPVNSIEISVLGTYHNVTIQKSEVVVNVMGNSTIYVESLGEVEDLTDIAP